VRNSPLSPPIDKFPAYRRIHAPAPVKEMAILGDERPLRADGPEDAMRQILGFTALRLGMQIHHARHWPGEREVWPALRFSAPQMSPFQNLEFQAPARVP